MYFVGVHFKTVRLMMINMHMSDMQDLNKHPSEFAD